MELAISDDEFFYGYLSEYLDGDLTPAEEKRFTAISANPQYAQHALEFKALRGKVQLGLESIAVDATMLSDLRRFVQSEEEERFAEATRVQQVERAEMLGVWRRRLIVGALIIIALTYGALQFKTPAATTFNPLEYVDFEAQKISADPGGRIDFPADSLKDIKAFFGHNPSLTFKPHILGSLTDSGYTPIGGTVVDYEVALVTVVVYEKMTTKGQYLFHFNYQGKLSDLPKSQEGEARGFNYQAYGTDKVNLIAWQHGDDSVSIVLGSEAANELALIARQGALNE